MKRFHFFVIMLCSVLLSSTVASAGERKTLMDAGWRFFKGEGETCFSEPKYDDSQWRIVDAEVFVNGHSLGVHHYGYSSFIHDVTPVEVVLSDPRDAANEVQVAVSGAAGLAALGNADIKELGTTVDDVHNVWKGHALAVFRASSDAGKATIKVTSPGLKPAKVTLKVK